MFTCCKPETVSFTRRRRRRKKKNNSDEVGENIIGGTDENGSNGVPTLFGEQGRISPKVRDVEQRIRAEFEKDFEKQKRELSEKLAHNFELRKNELQKQFDAELKREEAESRIEIGRRIEKEIREKVEKDFETKKLDLIQQMNEDSKKSMVAAVEKMKQESEKSDRKLKAVVSHLQGELVASELLIRDAEAREADLINENAKLRKIVQDKQIVEDKMLKERENSETLLSSLNAKIAERNEIFEKEKSKLLNSMEEEKLTLQTIPSVL